MPYIHFEEETIYARKLGELFEALDSAATHRGDEVHRDLFILLWPYDQLWFIIRHAFWWRDLYFERRHRQHARTPLFISWHNTEVFAIPPAERPRFYVSVPDWWREIGVSSLLTVPSASVLVYFSHSILDGTERLAEDTWRVARSEWVVMAILSFLAAFPDGTEQGNGTDPRLETSGVIVPLPRRLVELVDSFHFFQIVRDQGFHAPLAYLAYHRTQMIDWSRQSVAVPYFHYEFQEAHTQGLDACSVWTRKRNAQGQTVYGETKMPAVAVEYMPGRHTDLTEARRLATDLFRAVDGTSDDGSSPSVAPGVE